jgi:hypothetical protein
VSFQRDIWDDIFEFGPATQCAVRKRIFVIAVTSRAQRTAMERARAFFNECAVDRHRQLSKSRRRVRDTPRAALFAWAPVVRLEIFEVGTS